MNKESFPRRQFIPDGNELTQAELDAINDRGGNLKKLKQAGIVTVLAGASLLSPQEAGAGTILDATKARNEVAKAESALTTARAGLSEVLNKKSKSEKEVQKFRDAVMLAQMALEEARAKLTEVEAGPIAVARAQAAVNLAKKKLENAPAGKEAEAEEALAAAEGRLLSAQAEAEVVAKEKEEAEARRVAGEGENRNSSTEEITPGDKHTFGENDAKKTYVKRITRSGPTGTTVETVEMSKGAVGLEKHDIDETSDVKKVEAKSRQPVFHHDAPVLYGGRVVGGAWRGGGKIRYVKKSSISVNGFVLQHHPDDVHHLAAETDKSLVL